MSRQSWLVPNVVALAVIVAISFTVAVVGGSPSPKKIEQPTTKIAQPGPPPLSLSQPVYLRRGAVRCLRETVLAAHWRGYQDGGDSAALWAVAHLFATPPLGCVRAPERERVRLLAQADKSYSALANIEWTGQDDWLVFLSSLEN
jgi:hypothetical protein